MPKALVMMSGMEAKLHEFLGNLNFLIERSGIAYSDYIEKGKSFFHAKILRKYNNEIRELLLKHAYLLPTDIIRHALELLRHIDVWTMHWDELYNTLNPSSMQEFVFPNDVRFPKGAWDAIREYYLQINSQNP